MTSTHWAALVGLALTTLLIALLIPVANHLHLVDHPDQRKRHVAPTPLVGGVAMYLGTLAGLLLSDIPLQTFGPFAAGATLLMVAGIIDDIRDLDYRIRLAVQCAAAGILIAWGGLSIDSLGNLVGLGPISLGPMTIPFTLFAVVGLINAINMLDGMDGLAGGVVVAILVPVSAYAAVAGLGHLAAATVVVIACVLGFLLFNYRFPWRHKAPAFMGDAGSTFLGFTLAWVMLSLFQHPESHLPPIGILWIVGFPVADTIVTMWRRRRKGLSVFRPDRDHIHYILQRSGFGINATVLIIAGLTALFATGALIASSQGVPQPLMTAAFVLLLYLHYRLISSAMRFTQRFRHLLTTHSTDE